MVNVAGIPTTLRNALAKVPYARRVKRRVWRTIGDAITSIKGEPNITSAEFDLTSLPALIGKEDPVILDVGSNDGTHTLAFLKLFKHPKIYAFEPDPRAAARFKDRVTDQRVKLFEFAVSDTNGAKTFFMSSGQPPMRLSRYFDFGRLPKDWDLSGSLRKPKRHLVRDPWCRFDRTIQVETKKLDTWFQEEGIESIDFIWADVNGAEIDMIRGAGRALRHTRYFYTEYGTEELYEGQASLKLLLRLLPDFEVVQRFWVDVLLKNKSVP